MLAESGGIVWCQDRGEAMENGVVSVEDLWGVSEFSGNERGTCRASIDIKNGAMEGVKSLGDLRVNRSEL